MCTVNPNPANDGTDLTATCTGVETGGSVSIPNYSCGAEISGTVICMGIAGSGGVTGDETATTSDAVGNTATSVAAFTLDNTAPTNPVITSPADGVTINDNTPTITGTGEPGSTVTVSGPLGESCSVVVEANGDWACDISPALQDGSNTLSAIAVDDADNQSATDSIDVFINSTASYELVVNAAAELVTTEMGGSDSFTVVLPLTPSADVTVNFSSSNTDEGTVLPTSVTFTPNNWDEPVTITATGVDDAVYDLDQDYQVIIGLLNSADVNYNGVDPADVDAVNIDDDESPDLSAFITNCVGGVTPDHSMIYQLTVSNTGNKDIAAANVATVMGNAMSTPDWICQTNGSANCGALSGSGDLNETVDLSVGSSITYVLTAGVTGQLMDFIDVEGSVSMPVSETDVNPSNNVAHDSDLIYQFLFKDSFECVAPGTIQSTQSMFESFNL